MRSAHALTRLVLSLARRTFATFRPAPLILGAAIVFGSPVAAAEVVAERVVAVVDGEPLLLSELSKRLQPFLGSAKTESERAAMYRQMLSKMVDERLIARYADAHDLRVSKAEIDAAIRRIADDANLTVEELFDQLAETTSMNVKAYREEVRLQLREGKVLYHEAQLRQEDLPEDPQATDEMLVKLRQELLARLLADVVVEVRVVFE